MRERECGGERRGEQRGEEEKRQKLMDLQRRELSEGRSLGLWVGSAVVKCGALFPPRLPDSDSQIVCVWPFGLLDFGSATLRCKI